MKSTILIKTIFSLSMVTLLWGCGGGQNTSSTSNQTTTPPATSTTDAANTATSTTESTAEPAASTDTATSAGTETTPPSDSETPAAEPPATQDDTALIAQGQTLAGQCLACHSVDGGAGVGPTWLALYGKLETLDDDSTVTVDEAYLRESIATPGAKIVKGFSNIMPPYAQLSEDEVAALIAYIKSLQE